MALGTRWTPWSILVASVPHHTLRRAGNASISPPEFVVIRGSANTGPNVLTGRITAIVAGPLPRKIGPEAHQMPSPRDAA